MKNKKINLKLPIRIKVNIPKDLLDLFIKENKIKNKKELNKKLIELMLNYNKKNGL